VVLSVVGLGLVGVVIVGLIYSMSGGQSLRRRRIGQRVSLLAGATLLVTNAISTPDRRWLNVGVAVFMVGAVVFQVVWDRRRKVS